MRFPYTKAVGVLAAGRIIMRPQRISGLGKTTTIRQVEQIVVTAQRAAQQPIDVPIAITAIGAVKFRTSPPAQAMLASRPNVIMDQSPISPDQHSRRNIQSKSMRASAGHRGLWMRSIKAAIDLQHHLNDVAR